MKELSCSDFLFLPLSAVMKKEKYYVVWAGVSPGIYTSWTDCQLQTKGYEGAKYKSFESREEAEKAFASSPYAYIKRSAPSPAKTIPGADAPLPAAVAENSLAVDAACSGNPGAMEYRGSTRRQPSGNLSLRADVWNQQYRRIPRHCPRTCLVETERFRHAHLQ